MPKYVIERTVPGAGTDGRRRAGRHRRSVQQGPPGPRPGLQWVQSYVSDDKITCVYLAANEDLIREHGRCGGFPVDAVLEVQAIIDPGTAELVHSAGRTGR